MEEFLVLFTYMLCHFRNFGIAFVPFYLLLRHRHSDRLSRRFASTFLLGVLALACIQITLRHKVDDWREDFIARIHSKCPMNFTQGYFARSGVPVFYISPEGTSGRRLNMERALGARGLQGVRVPAVTLLDLVPGSRLDGRNAKVQGLPQSLPSAVLLSHLLAARRLWLSGVEWGIVVEDDANFDLECFWKDDELGKLIDSLSPQWQAVHLYTGLYLSEPALKFRRARLQGLRAFRFVDLGGKNNYYWGAVGYALHRRGAEKLLTLFAPSALQPENDLVIDFRGYKPMVSEEMLRALPFLYHSTRPLIAHGPFLPSHPHFESLIHISHSDFHQMSNDILLRFFYDDQNPVSLVTALAFLKLLPGYSWANTMTIVAFLVCGHRILHIIFKLKPGTEKRFVVFGLLSIALLSLFLQTALLDPL